ncbi:MAG: phospho-sugar mutase [Opitutales bacterium]|nr:phospho-sugar mutase [Opitutales bacterium]
MQISEAIKNAHDQDLILDKTFEILSEWLDKSFLPDWALSSLQELIDTQNWDEINNRFYQNITFGTGGMRGRTISYVTTEAEKGTPGEQGTPEHAALGSTLLNDFNIARATIALFRYTKAYLDDNGRSHEIPSLVIAHDVRHYSRFFCELCASTWSKLGGNAFIFEGPRSTPQLSFSVRYLNAHAGVVITASHNPYHDNGFKAYFEDGGQVVSPHAEGIVEEFGKVELQELPSFLNLDLERVVILGKEMDEAYIGSSTKSLINERVIAEQKPKIVFTPIHGTGAIASIPMLEAAGVSPVVVEEQMVQDPNFPTVKSPNPENADALSMAVSKAKEVEADLLIGTDPDCDRMAVAARDDSGEYVILSGNMTGSLLAAYRIEQFKKTGLIPEEGTESAALIKTFVTTPLQEKIAKDNGLKVINTLTGFKWIGEKLSDWQKILDEAMLKEGIALDYDRLPLASKRDLLLKHSTFYVFGGEESFGYLCDDSVRDKDGNAATLAVVELAAYLKSEGKTLLGYLDEIYVKYGYYLETLGNVYLEGASGAQQIKNILSSYRSTPPESIGGVAVTGMKDFGVEEIYDADEKKIPAQDFYLLSLANGYQYAVRGSGTEPKIKFYVFASSSVSGDSELESVKTSTKEEVERIKNAIIDDAMTRVS